MDMIRRQFFKLAAGAIAALKVGTNKVCGDTCLRAKYVPGKYKLKLYISPEAMEEIRSCNVDQIDYETRKAILTGD